MALSIPSVLIGLGLLGSVDPAAAAPPWSGTAFIAPGLVTDSDPTSFSTITDRGLQSHSVFDRRIDSYVIMNVFVYDASFVDGKILRFLVNPEFGDVAASRQPVQFYAPVFGRLPNALRRGVAYVWVHKGDHPFGGTPFDGNPAILIHTGALAQSYINQGVLEEILIHEASHAVLDSTLHDSAGWLAA